MDEDKLEKGIQHIKDIITDSQDDDLKDCLETVLSYIEYNR